MLRPSEIPLSVVQRLKGASMRVVTLLGLLIAFAVPLALAGQRAPAPPPPCSPSDSKYICGQDAPEDLVVVPGSEWVLASAFGGKGGIRLINVKDKTSTVAFPSATSKEQLNAKVWDTCPGPPEQADKDKF